MVQIKLDEMEFVRRKTNKGRNIMSAIVMRMDASQGAFLVLETDSRGHRQEVVRLCHRKKGKVSRNSWCGKTKSDRGNLVEETFGMR